VTLEPVAQLLAGLVSVTLARGIVVFAAAWTVTRFARKLPGGARHLVWLGAIASFVLIPLAWFALPGLHVGSSIPRGQAAVWRLAVAPVLSRIEYTNVIERTSVGRVLQELPPALPMDKISAALLLLWAAGAAVLVIRLAIGAVKLRRLACGGVTGERLESLAKEVASGLAIRGRFRLILSARCSMPFSFGAFFPAVVLPSGAGEWPGDRLAPVLTHELAHVRRRDVLTQSAAYAVCVLFWFVPPVWIAYAALLREAENSCDQHVIDRGIRGPRYAQSILDLARSCRERMLFPCISAAVGHRSMLIQRISAILTLKPARRSFGLRDAARVLVVCLCCLLPVLAVFGTAQSLPLAKDDPFFGTWVNEDYDASGRYKCAKTIVGHDGRELGYRHFTDTQPVKECWNTVTKSWVDASGAHWYKVRVVEWVYPSRGGKVEGFNLIRISPDGNTVEWCFAQFGYPEDVGPLGSAYGIQYRQK